MKRLTLPIIAMLCAVMLLTLSCRTQDRTYTAAALETADSLMDHDPHAALDTLLRIRDREDFRPGKSGRAMYALLLTEARYKCYEPVARDSAIFDAARYYRKHGDRCLYARALVMQGAVLFEQGDAVAALESYKKAEPLLAQSGDLEQLGLLHTRIGELYQHSILNYSYSLDRYTKALSCFEKAGIDERTMYAHVSLAMALISADSCDAAAGHIEKGLEMARQAGDRMCSINAYHALVYLYRHQQNDSMTVNTVERLTSEFGSAPMNDAETDLYNNFLYAAAISAARMHRPEEARRLAGILRLKTAVDSLSYFFVMTAVYETEQDWQNALSAERASARITNELLKDGYNQHLEEAEKKYEHSELINELQKHKSRNILHILIILLMAAAAATGYFILKFRDKSRKLRLSEAVNDIQALRNEIEAIHKSHEHEIESLQEQNKNIRDRYQYEEDMLRGMLLRQVASNTRLMSLNGDMFATLDALADICYIYKGSAKLSGLIEHKLLSALSDNNTLGYVDKMLELTFPGFMSSLFNDFPWMKEDDRKLITLMCGGLSTSTVSIMIRTDPSSLNAKKYRLARKMGINGRLSTYLKNRLNEYNSRKSK